MQLEFKLRNETKTCYRFEHKTGTALTTLYLKKSDVDACGISPQKGICVTIEENKHD